MHLSPALSQSYTRDTLTAREAQRQAECIAWAPVAFQVARLLKKWQILALLNDSSHGLTLEDLQQSTDRSHYALTILTDAGLSLGLLLVDPTTDRFSLSKTGWFLLTDPATAVNLNFNHDVNYQGMFHLEEALTTGKPAGLKTLGDWSTIYEGLSQLPPDSLKSWLAFDHFYSDGSFDAALPIVFSQPVRHLLDIGGNTGRFALRCVGQDANVRVTIADLPGQISMMRSNIAGASGEERIDAFPIDWLRLDNTLPTDWTDLDVVWMSQFLDCFSEPEILSILQRTAQAMQPHTRLFILETLWDRQRFEPAAFCLTMTSVYFTAMANGNSKMYHSDRLFALIKQAGLSIASVHDHLGQGHSLIEVRKA